MLPNVSLLAGYHGFGLAVKTIEIKRPVKTPTQNFVKRQRLILRGKIMLSGSFRSKFIESSKSHVFAAGTDTVYCE